MSDQEAKPTAEPGAKPATEANNLAMLIHVTGIFFSFLGPLIIWVLKKEEHEFVDDQGKETLNWEITMAIAYAICGVLSGILIGLLILPLVGIVDLVFNIIGATKANQGVRYRYPFALRLIK